MTRKLLFLALTLALALSPAHADNPIATQIGADNNSADNPFIQPTDPALSGGGRDQTLQFGDLLIGRNWDDLLIGRLGTDVLVGGGANDVLVGGTEHFNSFNRDRAFGGPGVDLFMWAPGDGSDLFIGGPGEDAVLFGLIGELENGEVVFRVADDQLAGDVYIDPTTGLPLMDVTNSPGFCEVIDESSEYGADEELEALGLDDLVRFSLRDVRDSFEAGEQSEDNGLRVTLHLKDVEVLVCASRDGGVIEYVDLTVSPPQLIDFYQLDPKLQQRLADIVF